MGKNLFILEGSCPLQANSHLLSFWKIFLISIFLEPFLVFKSLPILKQKTFEIIVVASILS